MFYMKNILFLALCYSISFTFSSCIGCGSGNSGDFAKGTGMYDSYQEACRAQDFEAAHKFIEELEIEANRPRASWERFEDYKNSVIYVFNHESRYLMSLNSPDAQKRIIYLIKELDKDTFEEEINEQIDALIDIAIDNDDADFAVTLLKQYSSKVVAVDKNALIDYLASKNERYLSETLLTLLSEARKQSVTKKPALGISEFDHYGGEHAEFIDECNDFKESVLKYNGLCKNALSCAIKHGNKYLAQRTVSMFTESINVNSLSTPKASGCCGKYNVTPSHDDIKEAKGMLNNAIAYGGLSE